MPLVSEIKYLTSVNLLTMCSSYIIPDPERTFTPFPKF